MWKGYVDSDGLGVAKSGNTNEFSDSYDDCCALGTGLQTGTNFASVSSERRDGRIKAN